MEIEKLMYEIIWLLGIPITIFILSVSEPIYHEDVFVTVIGYTIVGFVWPIIVLAFIGAAVVFTPIALIIFLGQKTRRWWINRR